MFVAIAHVFLISSELKGMSFLFVLNILNYTISNSEITRAKGVENSPHNMINDVNVHLPFPTPVAASASGCSLLTLVGAIPHAWCPKVIAEKDEPLKRTCAFLFVFA